MKLRDGDIQSAHQRSIVAYLQSAGVKGFYQRGRWWCSSPLRDEQNASFSVTLDKNLWYDHGLGVGGDLIELVMKLNGYHFIRAVQHIEGLSLRSADEKDSAQPSHSSEVSTSVPPDNGQAKSGRKTVEKFFASAGLPYYPEIEAFPLSYKKGSYIGFPVPTPAIRAGIECRGFEFTDKGLTPNHRRMTLGNKLPWLFLRDSERYLVSESIFDSLAGEKILDDSQMSLFGLNGVGNVKFLPDYIPDESYVLLALDNDGQQNGKIGQCMEQEAEKLLLAKGCRVSHVTRHVIAGVKDLYRLLQLENQQ